MSQDREFEKYLQGKSELSKLYADLPEVELPQAEFPRHLDAAILAEAHRAVGARPGAKPKRRWTIPLGMVATLFVAVMIGLQLPYMLKDAASPQQYKEEKIAAMMDKGMAERDVGAPEERKKVQETSQLMPKLKSEITRGNISPMAAEEEAPAKANAPALAAPKASPEITGSSYTSVAPATQNAPAPIVMPQAPAKAAKRLELRESADIDTGMALSKEKKTSGQAAASVSDSLEQRTPAAATMAVPPPVQLNRSQMQPLKDEASDASLTPEDWLKRIKRLKQEGKLEEAKKDLAAFKKRYPDYPVPQALELL
jgi:resuscitation-promoting factor RpfA